MSNQFAMLSATRKIENYLSREEYNLKKMSTNPNVSESLLQSRVEQHNGLVDALNGLFGSLVGEDEALFDRSDILDGVADTQIETFEVVGHSYDNDEADLPVKAQDQAASQFSPPDEPEQWVLDGYPSKAHWLEDRELEAIELPDDTALSVDSTISQKRAGGLLEDYDKTATRDVATYLPEDDTSVDVIQHARVEADEPEYELDHDDDVNDVELDLDDDDDGEIALDDEPMTEYDKSVYHSTRSTEDQEYRRRTADNIVVDDNPAQITEVRTAVEMDTDAATQGTSIDVSSFMHRTDSVADDFISNDLTSFIEDADSDNDNDTLHETSDIYEPETDSDDVSESFYDDDAPAEIDTSAVLSATLPGASDTDYGGVVDTLSGLDEYAGDDPEYDDDGDDSQEYAEDGPGYDDDDHDPQEYAEDGPGMDEDIETDDDGFLPDNDYDEEYEEHPEDDDNY